MVTKRATLSSKERVLLAINHQEPDHVPLTFKTGYGGGYFQSPFSGRDYMRNRSWRNEYERVEILLELGTDPFFRFHFRPLQLSPDVKIRTWREPSPQGEDYPLLFKEYHTPKGVLRQVIRLMPDWAYYGFYTPLVPLWCDQMVPPSRSKEFLVEGMEDLDSVSCLFVETTERELKVTAQEAEQVKRFAERHGVLVRSAPHLSLPMLGDGLVFCMGAENMMMMAYESPQTVHRLLDIFLDWSMRCVRQILDLHVVDMIIYRAWYETTSFWTPEMYRTFIGPRLKKLVDIVHEGGAKFCHCATSDFMALLPTLMDAGIDVLFGPDPAQDRSLDMSRLKSEVGNRICFWGGVNSWVTLGRGTRKDIEREVTGAVQTLGPGGGLILSAVDVLSYHFPWDNIEHMIRAWQKVRNYPNLAG